MSDNVIEVDGLSFRINNAQILSQVSLSVERHEFVGLIGPNGSGKSTLLKHIYRHYQPGKATVYLNGEDIARKKPKEIAREMAVVAQENNPDFDFTVFEMLMMARYAHKKIFDRDSRDDEEVCDRALAIVGLSDTKRRSFLSLSGGEKQRIYLAMAFAQESELILLDEPTNHLDIGYQLSMMEVLRSFREKTVFTSVHDMNLAAWYCDRLLLLNHGKIIRVGTPEEVLTPELIRNVFHVNAAVNRRPEDGRIQISYLSYIRS